jgi:hypothetical protein
MDTWMFAQERNTLYMAKTRSSMISVSKQVRCAMASVNSSGGFGTFFLLLACLLACLHK